MYAAQMSIPMEYSPNDERYFLLSFGADKYHFSVISLSYVRSDQCFPLLFSLIDCCTVLFAIVQSCMLHKMSIPVQYIPNDERNLLVSLSLSPYYLCLYAIKLYIKIIGALHNRTETHTLLGITGDISENSSHRPNLQQTPSLVICKQIRKANKY